MNKKKVSYPQEAWEGGVIGMLACVAPLVVGIINLMFGLSRIPIPRWIMISIGGIVFFIGMIPFILSLKVAVKGSSNLVTDGIYAHIRHPHYLSNIIWGFSGTFFFSSWWSLLVFIVSLPVVYYLIRREERKLMQKYGEEYIQYRERVPMFLPRIGGRS